MGWQLGIAIGWISMPFRNEIDVGWGLAILFFSHATTAKPYVEKPPLLHRVEKYNIKLPCSLTSLTCYEWDGSLELRLDGISMPFSNEVDVRGGTQNYFHPASRTTARPYEEKVTSQR